MNKTKPFIALSACLLLSTHANAAVINLTGELELHNDVVYMSFTLENDATNFRIWTDSYQNGVNFDPISALWNEKSGNLISETDDNATINPSTQTSRDSGFQIQSLAAGDYVFTIAAYNNFANSSILSDGFTFDSQDPIALSDWCQPYNSCNPEPLWSVWLDVGVENATVSPVPEPSTYALMLGGLGLVGFMAARRQAKKAS